MNDLEDIPGADGPRSLLSPGASRSALAVEIGALTELMRREAEAANWYRYGVPQQQEGELDRPIRTDALSMLSAEYHSGHCAGLLEAQHRLRRLLGSCG